MSPARLQSKKVRTNAYSAREGVYMKLGIVGYGNLGKGCEKFVLADRDIQLVGIFTRRDASKVKSEYGTPIYDFADVFSYENKIDVLCVCVGSANDLQDVQKKLANRFCTIGCIKGKFGITSPTPLQPLFL